MKIRRFREKKGYGENLKKDKSEPAKYSTAICEIINLIAYH